MPHCPISQTRGLFNAFLQEGRMGFTAWRKSEDQVDQIVKELMNTIYPLEWGMSGLFNINHKLCTRHLVMFDINLKVYKIKCICLFIRHQKIENNAIPKAFKLWSKPDRAQPIEEGKAQKYHLGPLLKTKRRQNFCGSLYASFTVCNPDCNSSFMSRLENTPIFKKSHLICFLEILTFSKRTTFSLPKSLLGLGFLLWVWVLLFSLPAQCYRLLRQPGKEVQGFPLPEHNSHSRLMVGRSGEWARGSFTFSKDTFTLFPQKPMARPACKGHNCSVHTVTLWTHRVELRLLVKFALAIQIAGG